MLPIDPLIPEIVASLRNCPNLVIEAAPGAGKTTRVPPALLALGGEVLVLEPRRLAARMAARRVASERGESVGQTVGYQVRFEESAGPQTRLRFLTEGVFTRRLISDNQLRGVGTVVLDEFHERHLGTDLALALLRRLQKTTRPDLRIVVMSATLVSLPISRFLDDCPVLRSGGRLFPLEIAYTPYSAAGLGEQTALALEGNPGADGHVLVFLPGAAEIRQAARACEAVAHKSDFLIAPLYGALTPAEQDLAVEPSKRRKLILATNIAESSLTIDGVTAVVDSGLARLAVDSPFNGLPSLEVKRISRASAIQRAGRAGRTGPGRVVRLFTAEDFHRRADHDIPEILRRELSSLCLELEAAGIHDPLELEWLDAPPQVALDAAESLLDRLHARGADARRMSRMPLHPRLSRLVLDGDGDALRAAALLSSGQRIQANDLFHAISEPFDYGTRAVHDQLRRTRPEQKGADLAQAALSAFPDRVGRRRSGETVLLSNGACIRATRQVHAEFLVALDVSDGLLRLSCPIEPEWLIDQLTERRSVEWNRDAERVEAVTALLYDQLVVEETRGGVIDDDAAAQLLGAKVDEAGLGRFIDREALDEFLARVEFASAHSEVLPLDEQAIRDALIEFTPAARSFAHLRETGRSLIPLLEQRIGANVLEQVAPSRLRLANGRMSKIHYERHKAPWVASRLQDFFGLTESPRVGRGKVPLVVHLLAPNQRAVQTTTDLAGFWERLYPQVRRELGRRYPRHSWPEKPV